MNDEPRGVVAFSNPIDPEAPPIRASVELELFPTDNDGLRQPITLPTPSIVFRRLDREEIVGFTVVIESGEPELVPGATFTADVTFVGVPAAEVSEGKEFALWHGRDVGHARVIALAS